MDDIESEVKAYVEERDAILAKDDLAVFIEWAKTKGIVFPDTERAEITRHKIITACESLPKELKARSRKWLLERGYHPLD